MGSSSEKLAQLRPVTFHLKTDPSGKRQYGLIAEEVAKVYPELVIRGASGKIEGVRYEELSPMLINEAQRQHGKIEELSQEIAVLRQQLSENMRRSDEMQAALERLQAKDSQVAMR
jgi:polyhydroxyalkanoate synthesis regulator phasin